MEYKHNIFASEYSTQSAEKKKKCCLVTFQNVWRKYLPERALCKWNSSDKISFTSSDMSRILTHGPKPESYPSTIEGVNWSMERKKNLAVIVNVENKKTKDESVIWHPYDTPVRKKKTANGCLHVINKYSQHQFLLIFSEEGKSCSLLDFKDK